MYMRSDVSDHIYELTVFMDDPDYKPHPATLVILADYLLTAIAKADMLIEETDMLLTALDLIVFYIDKYPEYSPRFTIDEFKAMRDLLVIFKQI